jgi:hypothetical protein
MRREPRTTIVRSHQGSTALPLNSGRILDRMPLFPLSHSDIAVLPSQKYDLTSGAG